MNKYKAQNFKRMKVVNHEFLQSVFHPKHEDVVICLERNDYPKNVHIYNLEKPGEQEEAEDIDPNDHNYESKKAEKTMRMQSVGKTLGNDDDLNESKASEA